MSFPQVYFYLLSCLIVGVIGGSLLIGTPDYLFEKVRNAELEKLATDFGLAYEPNMSFWSFMPPLRYFFYDRPWYHGMIRRHHASGKVGDTDVEVYDSENFVQSDIAAVYLKYARRIRRTIIKINGNIDGNLTLPRGFTPVDQLRMILQHFQGLTHQTLAAKDRGL